MPDLVYLINEWGFGVLGFAPEVRGQAQSLIVMLTQGLGLGIGAQAFGWLGKQCTENEVLDYASFWYIPAGFAFAVLIVFAIGFWDRSVDENVDKEAKPA